MSLQDIFRNVIAPKVGVAAPAPAAAPLQAFQGPDGNWVFPAPGTGLQAGATPGTFTPQNYIPLGAPGAVPGQPQAAGLPSWVLPVAIAAGVLLLMPLLFPEKRGRHA